MKSWIEILQVMWRLWVSSPIKRPHCFIAQETLPLLLISGWIQERIRALNIVKSTKVGGQWPLWRAENKRKTLQNQHTQAQLFFFNYCVKFAIFFLD